jgi:hypothetical protein
MLGRWQGWRIGAGGVFPQLESAKMQIAVVSLAA